MMWGVGHYLESLEKSDFSAAIFVAELYKVEVSATFAPESSAIVANINISFLSLRGSGGNTGTATNPARTQAMNEMM